MSVRRLCKKCNIYSVDSDYCSNCGDLINFEKIKKEESAKSTYEKKKHKPEEDLERIFEKIKNSRYLPVRIVYKVFYSIWFVFAAIISFFMFIIATMPG